MLTATVMINFMYEKFGPSKTQTKELMKLLILQMKNIGMPQKLPEDVDKH